MKIIILCLTVIGGGMWGWYQPVIFPYEKFGILFVITAFVGGYIIGQIGWQISKELND